MACVGATAYAALRRLEVTPHESLAVFGLGPVGLSCVVVGKAMGLRVIGSDVSPARLEIARACGADSVVDARSERITGYPWQDGIDYVIETSGSTAARECMLPSIKRGGRIAIVGVGSTEKVINPNDIHGKAATVIGSVVFPLGWSWDFSRFIAASGLSFEPAVTHRFSLDQAEEALRVADEGLGGKVIFAPHGV